MKKIFRPILVYCCLILTISCSSIPPIPFLTMSGRGWPSGKKTNPAFPVLAQGTVTVDKSSGWASIENEISRLAPGLFSEKGYRVADKDSGSDYIFDVTAIEREYLKGWKTERSISVEVLIYPGGGEYQAALPAVIGRAASSGTYSLASSRDLEKLLRYAINRAVKVLQKL
jgi:hypothetical protein